MKIPLYSTEMTFNNISIPKYVDIILTHLHHPLHPNYHQKDIEKIRRLELKSSSGIIGRFIYGKKVKIHKITDLIAESDEIKIPLRIYQSNEEENKPVLIFFHGGGYIQGSIDVYDRFCRNTAKKLDTIIVSVEYRLAPETPFPGAVEDCLFATKWVWKNICKYSGDNCKIIVMGDSAGGGLAAIVAQELKSHSNIQLYGQILLYPWLDLLLSTNSVELFNGYILNKQLAEVILNAYVPEMNKRSFPKLSPIYAPNVSGLPRSLIITASHDPLRDEGLSYAKRLLDAGNKVSYKNYLRTFHGFLSAKGIMPRGKKMYKDFILTVKHEFF